MTKKSTDLELLISRESIEKRVADIAQQIDREYVGREIVFIMVLKGAFIITADLIRHIHLPHTLEWIQASSYGPLGVQRGELSITGTNLLSIRGKDVILIDDIFDSGATLFEIYNRLMEKHPRSLKSLVLLSKDVPRETSYRPDYTLFQVENQFVVGYGLDYKEHYRGLPGIYILSEHKG